MTKMEDRNRILSDLVFSVLRAPRGAVLQTQGLYFQSQVSKPKLSLGCPGPLLNSKGKRHLEPGDRDSRCLCLESSSWFSHPCSSGSHHHTSTGLPGQPVVGIIALTLSSLLRRLFSPLGSQILEDARCFVHLVLVLTRHLACVDPKERSLNRSIDESSIPLPSPQPLCPEALRNCLHWP